MDKQILAGLAALTLLDIAASTARADDWSGPYIGIHGGYRWSDARLSTGAYTLSNPFDLDPAIGARSESYDLGSGILGVQGGYNFKLPGNWLIGLEADASGGNGDDTKSRTITVDGVAYNLVSQAELNWQATLRARLGFTSGPWMIYATGGVAWADFDWSESFSRAGAFNFSVSKSELLTGYAVGGGAEYALSSHWILRGEYLFEDFGSVKVPLAAALPAGTTGNIDLDAHKLRFGVNYRF